VTLSRSSTNETFQPIAIKSVAGKGAGNAIIAAAANQFALARVFTFCSSSSVTASLLFFDPAQIRGSSFECPGV
jgi:hypothetical protein